VNHNHGTNIIQSDSVESAGSGDMLGLMLNQISTQLQVLLILLRHNMALIAIGTTQSSDDLTQSSDFIILQKHNLYHTINPLILHDSLSRILYKANLNKSLPHSSIAGHGHMITKW
jgi:hypothetical protein